MTESIPQTTSAPGIAPKRKIQIALLAILVCPALLLAFLLAALARYQAPVAFDEHAASGISFTPMRDVVPGPGIPDDLPLMRANNNLDVVAFGGEFYMAFRTAPFHFASEKARLFILRSADRQQWQRDAEFALESDLREPRLLVFNNKLFLYFFQAGTHMLKFEPKHIYAAERLPGGDWTAPRTVYEPGYVAWRIKARGTRAYMSVYYGENIYAKGRSTGEIRLLCSEDGYQWTPVSPEPQLTDAGAEEAEFEFDPDGNLVVLVRQELRAGSTLCMASKDDLGKWRSQYSPCKYDSSYMFRRANQFYVIARRNVAGPCDRELHFLPESMQIKANFAHYSLTRKRTALYRVDLNAMRLIPLFDFPSKGDTAFAAMAPLDDNTYYLLNYSSPLDGCDWPWLFGQLLPTRIYAAELRFP